MELVPRKEIANRIVLFQKLLQEEDVHCAVIRQPADLYYFTGTVQDAHLIVPADGNPVYLVRRHRQRALEQSPLRPILSLNTIKELRDHVDGVCSAKKGRRIGLELDVLPTSTFFFYDEKIFPADHLVDIGTLVRRLRMVKSPWEIRMMRRAAKIASKVAASVPTVLQEGMDEWDLLAELERVARRAGHLGFSRVRAFNLEIYFGHILSGPEAATPSYGDSPTGGPGLSPAFGQGAGRRSIRTGDLVSIDTMLNFNGYLNDQTRNFSLGPPHPLLREAHRRSVELHQWFCQVALPGSRTGNLYEMVVEKVDAMGWSEHFMGPGGDAVSFVAHGLGLEVDEFPFVAKGQKLVLREGMTLAFEPKWVIPGIGVAGIENTYLVTGSGLESLNETPEDLMEIS